MQKMQKIAIAVERSQLPSRKEDFLQFLHFLHPPWRRMESKTAVAAERSPHGRSNPPPSRAKRRATTGDGRCRNQDLRPEEGRATRQAPGRAQGASVGGATTGQWRTAENSRTAENRPSEPTG